MNPQTYYPSEGRLEMMSFVDESIGGTREEMPRMAEVAFPTNSYKGITTRLLEYFQAHPEERKVFS